MLWRRREMHGLRSGSRRTAACSRLGKGRLRRRLAGDGAAVDDGVLNVALVRAALDLEVAIVAPLLVASFHELATSQYGVPLSSPKPIILMAWPPSIGSPIFLCW